MRHRNNLSDWTDNSLHEVRRPAEAYVHVASYASNTYVGAAQAYGKVWARVELQPGEHVVDTFGGVFVCDEAMTRRWPARSRLNEKHLFEHGSDPDDRWDTDAIAGPSPWAGTLPAARKAPTVSRPAGHVASPVGRSDDYLLAGTHLLADLDP